MSVDHYENFPVASLLCPPALRPAVVAIYHFARTADDLADEGNATTAERAASLRDYRADLIAVVAGETPSPRWAPVFGPLAREMHRLQPPLLHDLLDAFEQDLTPPRYRDREHLLDYCRRSANPVGRLLLGLYGVSDAVSLRRSDAICSALQLMNFWQDFSRDGPNGRLYVPQDDLDRHGVNGDDVLACRDSSAARQLIADLCTWARQLMLEGRAAGPEPTRPHRLGAAPGRAGRPAHSRQDRGQSSRQPAAPPLSRGLGRASVAVARPDNAGRTMSPEQYVQEKAAASGSSFYYAFLFLPPARRAAITAFYAFCREVDDVVDETHDAGVAATKLAWWRKEVTSAFAGQPSHPVMKALMPHATTYDIRLEHLNAVIEGCDMDLQQTRYLDYPGLARYCHLVAGVVGEVASGIFGRTQPQTVEYAHKLGLSMQLTNIIRDVGDDARRGRIYLPVNELQQFGVKANEILLRSKPWGYSERFTALMKFQAERAHRLYDEALALLPEVDRTAQKPGLMMANIYRALLVEIEREDFQVLHQRIALTPLRKLWIAMKTNWRGK